MTGDATMKTGAEIRSAIVAYCEWAMDNADQIHYAQIRPMPKLPRKLPMVTDCSGFATLAYKDAGAPDPNGAGYNGTGYTGTLMQHGKQIGYSADGSVVMTQRIRPGDLIIFGDYPGHHVTVYLRTWHGAWVTCSHGQEIGPIEILNNRERLAQRRGFQVRSYIP